MAKVSKTFPPLPLPQKEGKPTTTIRVSSETLWIFYRVRTAMMAKAEKDNISVSDNFGGIYSTNQIVATVLRDFADRYGINIARPPEQEKAE